MWKTKRILLISFGIALFLALLFIQIIKAQTDNFSVKWTLVHDGISHKEYLVEIQNLDPDSEHDFNLEAIIRNTNFPLQQVRNFYIYEWKALPKEFPTYDVRTVNQTCYNNQTNETYDCSYNETYQNGTVTKLQNDWKSTKMQLIVGSDKVKADYGLITIPKYGSKAKTDDFGDIETVNGTKKFKIAFDVPITRTAFGFGSSGEIGILDLNTNNYYHPWWNASWFYRRPITINNTQNSNTLTDYQVAINLTYSSNMQPDFSDIRFTWYNSTSDTETEIPYWIESKVNSQWAYVWVKVIQIPASSTATIYVYYGNTSVVNSASNQTAVCPAGSPDDKCYYIKDEFLTDTSSDYNERQEWDLSGVITYTWDTTNSRLVASATAYHTSVIVHNLWIPNNNWKAETAMMSAGVDWGCLGLLFGENFVASTRNVTIFDTADDPNLKRIYNQTYNGSSVVSTTLWSASFTGSPNTWYSYEVIGWGNDSYSFYINGVLQATVVAKKLETSKMSNIRFGFCFRPYLNSYNEYVDYLRVYAYTNPSPTYSIGAEETYQPLAITIFLPLNQTYYGISNIEAKFKAEDLDNTTFSIKAWLDGELKYENNSYLNNTNISLNLENLVGKSYNFTVLADDGIYTNSKTIIFYNWHGLNISVFQANETAISSWNLLSKNSTNEIYFSGKTNPSLFEWKDLTQGESNLTVNTSSLFDNETKSFVINNSMGFQQVNFILYRIQQWKAKNNNTLADIQNFSVLFSNETFSAYFTTTNYKINPSLRELPFGNVSAKFSSFGFNDTWITYNINSSSVLNETVYLNPAGLKIDVWDEKTLEKLTFNVTITNATSSQTFTNQTTFWKLWNEIPNGDITITIIDLNGTRVQRKYFVTLTEYTYIYLKGYLLKSVDGMIVRFHIRTAEESPIANAIFTAKRFINNEWQTIEQAKSDDSGVTTVFLDPLATYSIIVEHSNYAAFSSSIQPTSQDYRIYLQKLYGETPKTIFDDINYYILPHEMNASLTNVTFYISCTSGTLEYFGMNITLMYSNHSVEGLYYTKITDKPYGDTLTASFDLTNKSGSEVTVKAFLKKQNFDEYEITKKYYVYSVTPGSYSLWTLITSLIPSSPWVAGTTTLATGILSLIVTGIGTSVVARKTLVGAGIVAIILLGIFTFMGWFSWKIYLLVCLVAISIMFLRGVI
jgi:hypothetical protein